MQREHPKWSPLFYQMNELCLTLIKDVRRILTLVHSLYFVCRLESRIIGIPLVGGGTDRQVKYENPVFEGEVQSKPTGWRSWTARLYQAN